MKIRFHLPLCVHGEACSMVLDATMPCCPERGERVYLGSGPGGRAWPFTVSLEPGHRVLRGDVDFVLVRLQPMGWSAHDEARVGENRSMAGLRGWLSGIGWREWPEPDPLLPGYTDGPGM